MVSINLARPARPSSNGKWPYRYPSEAIRSAPASSVSELAGKKGVKMAQIAFAWSAKKVTAPIIGTTKLDNLDEMIGKNQIPFVNAEC